MAAEMRVVFFGAGNFTQTIWKEISNKPEYYVDDYLAFADNNSNLWGDSLWGIDVIAPSDICKYQADLVVITSIYEKAIFRQLQEELDIPFKKICTFNEYVRKCYANWVYRKQYGNSKADTKESIFNIDNMVIYTAITGNYDELKDPLYLSDSLTYVCITNNQNIKSKVWNIEYVNDNVMDNIHLARHIKMNPHIFFHEYDTSVWVDGKYKILDDLRRYVSFYQRESKILCFPHPERQCICDEIAACIILKKGHKRDMLMQVSDYIREGYPLNWGLYETGCMVRAHNDEKVKFLMERWEKEILKYSIRDQLSFPYVCWKNEFEPDICSLDINKNPWLIATEHTIN